MVKAELTATDHYLRDLFRLLIERAREARQARGETSESGDSFEAGRAAAYYETVSTAIGQLKSFGLSPERYELPPNFDPDRELA